jgi:alpha-tubulin suppressor-like RCC1 family protein
MPRSQYLLPGLLLLATLASCSDPTSTEPDQSQVAEPEFATTATALSFYQVSAGQAHTCGLTLDGRLYCWGSNAFGQLGDGTITHRLKPVAVAGALRFRQVSAGSWHTCGVTTDYRAYCWGANEDRGTLGDGTEINRSTPVPVAGGLRFRLVEGGSDHTCGVSYPDNKAYCWGYGAEGALGDGEYLPRLRLTPVAVVGGHQFRQVAAGVNHTCGATISGEAYCWGGNKYGQLGDSVTRGGTLTPSLVAGKHQFRQVDAGAEFSCGVTTGYKAYCWGNGRLGQIGDGKPYLRFWPRAVAGGLSLERVSTGEAHACAETTTNRVYCWGGNFYGQLGDGTNTQRMTPVIVASGLFFNQVSAGGIHTCARTDTAVAYCWGGNFGGQLGDGTRTNRTRPVRVAAPT